MDNHDVVPTAIWFGDRLVSTSSISRLGRSLVYFYGAFTKKVARRYINKGKTMKKQKQRVVMKALKEKRKAKAYSRAVKEWDMVLEKLVGRIDSIRRENIHNII